MHFWKKKKLYTNFNLKSNSNFNLKSTTTKKHIELMIQIQDNKH